VLRRELWPQQTSIAEVLAQVGADRRTTTTTAATTTTTMTSEYPGGNGGGGGGGGGGASFSSSAASSFSSSSTSLGDHHTAVSRLRLELLCIVPLWPGGEARDSGSSSSNRKDWGAASGRGEGRRGGGEGGGELGRGAARSQTAAAFLSKVLSRKTRWIAFYGVLMVVVVVATMAAQVSIYNSYNPAVIVAQACVLVVFHTRH
jgi:hypothetical protein